MFHSADLYVSLTHTHTHIQLSDACFVAVSGALIVAQCIWLVGLYFGPAGSRQGRAGQDKVRARELHKARQVMRLNDTSSSSCNMWCSKKGLRSE